MQLLGFDLDNDLIKSLVAVLVTGLITVLSILRFYLYITCGKFVSNVN